MEVFARLKLPAVGSAPVKRSTTLPTTVLEDAGWLPPVVTSSISPSVKTACRSCLEWTIDPAEALLSIAQIDDCCWRLTIDDSCEQLEKIKEYEVTVTDTCNNGSDSVIIEMGKVIVDVQDTAVNPQSGTVAVDINLTNPENHLRALSFDITVWVMTTWYVPVVRPILTVPWSSPVQPPSNQTVTAEW